MSQPVTIEVAGRAYEVKYNKDVRGGGGYWVWAESPSGSKQVFRVAKAEIGNASVRGGAYRTVWKVKDRGHHFMGETRHEVVAATIKSLSERFAIRGF